MAVVIRIAVHDDERMLSAYQDQVVRVFVLMDRIAKDAAVLFLLLERQSRLEANRQVEELNHEILYQLTSLHLENTENGAHQLVA